MHWHLFFQVYGRNVQLVDEETASNRPRTTLQSTSYRSGMLRSNFVIRNAKFSDEMIVAQGIDQQFSTYATLYL